MDLRPPIPFYQTPLQLERGGEYILGPMTISNIFNYSLKNSLNVEWFESSLNAKLISIVNLSGKVTLFI